VKDKGHLAILGLGFGGKKGSADSKDDKMDEEEDDALFGDEDEPEAEDDEKAMGEELASAIKSGDGAAIYAAFKGMLDCCKG
jgi:hypothetical protein